MYIKSMFLGLLTAAFIILGTSVVYQKQVIQIQSMTIEYSLDVIQGQQGLLSILQTDQVYWKKYRIPYQYLSLIRQECNRLDLDLDFMVALMRVESNYNANATSNRDARGLMQVQWPTATDVDSSLTSFWQLYTPEVNIRIGAEYFRYLLDRYNENYDRAAMAYNYGPARFDELWAEGEYSTRYPDMIRGLLQ